MSRAMSKRKIRRIIDRAIVTGPTEPQQFRDLRDVALAWIIPNATAPFAIAAIVLRWHWRVLRLLAMPFSAWVMVGYYRRKRVRTIQRWRKERNMRDEAKRRIHERGPKDAG